MARKQKKEDDVLKAALSQAEVADMGRHYAELMREIEHKDDDRKAENRVRREEIKRLQLDADKLQEQIITGQRDATIFDETTL